MSQFFQFIKVMISSCLLLFLAACAQPPDDTAQPIVPQTQPQMLFIQAAAKATLIPVTDQPGNYILTLYRVNRSVLWFADRPVHSAGSYPISEFMQDWTVANSSSFVIHNPVATLFSFEQVAKTATRADSPIFILSYPIYSDKQREISYQAVLIPGSPLPPLSTYEDVGLFIEMPLANS